MTAFLGPVSFTTMKWNLSSLRARSRHARAAKSRRLTTAPALSGNAITTKANAMERHKCEQLLHFSRGEVSRMKAAVVTTLIVAASALHVATAAAQSHFEAVPSVTIGGIYDDN